MRISLYVMSSRKLQAFFIGLISLIGLIGLIGPISPISLIAPSGLRLACPKPPKKCPFDTKITSNPHFFLKKSGVIACLFGKRLYLCTRFRKRRRIKSRSLTDCDTRQGSMADFFSARLKRKSNVNLYKVLYIRTQ
jgi:hypothetical protein